MLSWSSSTYMHSARPASPLSPESPSATKEDPEESSSPPLHYLSRLLLALTIPSEIHLPIQVIMDKITTRMYETHEEIFVDRPESHASVVLFPSQERVQLSVEGRRSEETTVLSDSALEEVFAVGPMDTQVGKCACTACTLQPGAPINMAPPPKPKRTAIIRDIDLSSVDEDMKRELSSDFWLSSPPPFVKAAASEREEEERRNRAQQEGESTPLDGSYLFPESMSSPPTTPRTPNANRSRRPSEKHDYGINWIEAFKMVPPRSRKPSNLADEVEGKLAVLEREREDEEEKREEMQEALRKIDRVCKRQPSIVAEEDLDKSSSSLRVSSKHNLFDSSITLKDIYGGPSSSEGVVFNTSISLDDIFAGITRGTPPKQARKEHFYYEDDDIHEPSALPPEVAALYETNSSHSNPLSSSVMPLAQSEVNMDDVFAALDKGREMEAHFYSSNPHPGRTKEDSEEVFSDSAISRGTGQEEQRIEEYHKGQSSSSSGCSEEESHGKRTSLYEESPPKTRKTSYLPISELFSRHEESTDGQQLNRVEEEEEWIERLAGKETEEILQKVFQREGHIEDSKKCTCSACDPQRSIYLERETTREKEERKRSLRVVDPVNISLEEVFEGTKSTKNNERGEIDMDEVFSHPVDSPQRSRINIEKWQPREIIKEIKNTPEERRNERRETEPLEASSITVDDVFGVKELDYEHPKEEKRREVAIVTPMQQRTIEEDSPSIVSAVIGSDPCSISPIPDITLIIDPMPLLEALRKNGKEKEETPILSQTTPIALRGSMGAQSDTTTEGELSESFNTSMTSTSQGDFDSSTATMTAGLDIEEVFSTSTSTISQSRVDMSRFQPKTIEKEDRRVNETMEAPRTRTLPDSQVTMDEIFEQTNASPVPPPRRAKAIESNEEPTAEVNLEEIFAGSFSGISQSRVDVSKYQPRTIEKEVRRPPVETVIMMSSRTLPDSIISVEEIFERPNPIKEIIDRPSTSTTSVSQQSEEKGQSTMIAEVNLVLKEEPAEIDLDEVFTATSSGLSQSIIDVSKYQPKIVEKEIRVQRNEQIVERPPRTLPDSDITVEEIFEPPKRTTIHSDRPTTSTFDEETSLRRSEPSSSDEISLRRSERSPSVLEEQTTETSEEPLVSAAETIGNELSEEMIAQAEVNLEEVFSASSSGLSQSRVDVSKFQPKTIDKEVRFEWKEEIVERPPRTLPNSDITVDEIFNQRPLCVQDTDRPSTSKFDEETPLQRSETSTSDDLNIKRSERFPSSLDRDRNTIEICEEPLVVAAEKVARKVSEEAIEQANIDLDEVFAAASSSYSESRVDLSKFQPRTVEKEIRVRRQEEIVERPKRILSDSEISVEDIFAPPKKEEERRTISLSQLRSERSPSSNEFMEMCEDSLSPFDNEEEMIEERIHEGDRIETAEVNLDEVFSSNTTGISQSRVDLSKYHPHTIEKEIRSPQQEEWTHRPTRTLPDSEITVDDIFEPPKPLSRETDRPTTSKFDIGENVSPLQRADTTVSEGSLPPELRRSERLPSTLDREQVVEEAKMNEEVPANIDLDQVFTATSSGLSQSRIDVSKYQPKIIEKEIRVQRNEEIVERPPRTLPDSDITVDEIFSPPKPIRQTIDRPSTSKFDDESLAGVRRTVTTSSEDNNDSVGFDAKLRIERYPSALDRDEVIRVYEEESKKNEEEEEQEESGLINKGTLSTSNSAVYNSSIGFNAKTRFDSSPLKKKTREEEVEADENDSFSTSVPFTSIPSSPPIAPPQHRKTHSISMSTVNKKDEVKLSVTVDEESVPEVLTVDISIPSRPLPVFIPPPPPTEPLPQRNSMEFIDAVDSEEEVKEARLISERTSPVSIDIPPAEISMDIIFNPDTLLLSPSRFDETKWKPRTLEREMKAIVSAVAMEVHPPSELPPSDVTVDEIFLGRLTTKEVHFEDKPVKKMTIEDLLEKESTVERSRSDTVSTTVSREGESWQDALSREMDEYETRRMRLGEDGTISMRSTTPSTISDFGSIRPGSIRSYQEPVVALLEKEKAKKLSVDRLKRPGSRGSWKVEHRLEHTDEGIVEEEERNAKMNGKVWRVDRVQRNEKTKSSSIEDTSEEALGATRIQIHAPIDAIDVIEREIDSAFDEALSPRSGSIQVKRNSIERVEVEVHQESPPGDEDDIDITEDHGKIVIPTSPVTNYPSDTLGSSDGVYRSITSLPSTSDTTKIVFPIEQDDTGVDSSRETERFVTSASIRLEKTLPTPDCTLERNPPIQPDPIIDWESSIKDRDLNWTPSSSRDLQWVTTPSEPTTLERKDSRRKRSQSAHLEGMKEMHNGLRWIPSPNGNGNYRSETTIYSKTTDKELITERVILEDKGMDKEDELEDLGRVHLRYPPESDRGSFSSTSIRVVGFTPPQVRMRSGRERRKKVIRHSRNSVSSTGSSSQRPDEEELMEVEVTNSFIVLRGSYNLVISKDEPLGRLLLSLSDGQPIVPAALDFSILPRLKRLLRECLMRRARSVSMSLSSRSSHLLAFQDPANANLTEAYTNLYNPVTNPEGKVNLCTAENRVCEKEVGEKLDKIRFHPDTLIHLQRYGGQGGIHETKKAFSEYFSRHLKTKVKEEEVVLLPTTTTAYDLLSHLVCDPGDIILTSTPCYARILNSVAERNQCRVENVPVDPMNPQLLVSSFEREFSTWSSKGERVRAIVIVNPNNPIGCTFQSEEMIEVIEWANKNEVFVIVDEILSGTLHSPPSYPFESLLSFRHRLTKQDNFAWMSSLSKDLGIPGVKVAITVIPSTPIRQALTKLENYSPVPPPSQLMLSQILDDQSWLDSTLSLSRSRLSAHCSFLRSSLADMGVPTTSAISGLCLMADFSKFLKESNEKGEEMMWKHFSSKGIVLTRGESVRAGEEGWFRIAFGVPKEELELGVRRIREALGMDNNFDRTIDYDRHTNGLSARNEWLVSGVRATSPGTTIESH